VHSFRYRDHSLHCEDVDLTRVAEAVGTPTYVYSASTVIDHYRRLDAALGDLDHQICYAVKANSNGAILRLLREEGAGFDIVSGGELFRVLKAGGDPQKCTFAGVGKSHAEIEDALEQGIYSVNVESESELEYINEIAATRNVRAPVALRVNPDVEASTHKYVSTGKQENKFGISLGRAGTVYERAMSLPNISVRGVQMHIGSQITTSEPFVAAIEKVAPLVRELKAHGDIEFFSVGGGLGIIYESSFASGSSDWWKGEPALSINDYATAIVPPLRELDLRILLEPGRLLVGNAGVLLTRIRYVKRTAEKQFAIVDAGMNDLIRPALYGSFHEIVPLNEPTGREPQKYDVVGPVCESGDFFAQDREMPEVAAGDLLAVMSAGAYGFVMASNYNSRTLPAEVLVRGEKFAAIRQRQSNEDLVRGEVDLDW